MGANVPDDNKTETETTTEAKFDERLKAIETGFSELKTLIEAGQPPKQTPLETALAEVEDLKTKLAAAKAGDEGDSDDGGDEGDDESKFASKIEDLEKRLTALSKHNSESSADGVSDGGDDEGGDEAKWSDNFKFAK